MPVENHRSYMNVEDFDQDTSRSNNLEPTNGKNKISSFILLVASIMLFVAITLISIRVSKEDNHRNDVNSVDQKHTDAPISMTSIPSLIPSSAPSSEEDIAINLFLTENLIVRAEEKAQFLVPGTPQWKAKRWMTREDTTLSWNKAHQYNSTQKIIQRYVLAVIYFSMSNGGHMDVDWLLTHECYSVSISCDDDGFIRSLEIGE
jgi:hypothetical protein